MDIEKTIAASRIDIALEHMLRTMIDYSLHILAAILILIIGWTISNWARNFVRTRLTALPRRDPTLTSFLSSFVKYGILLVTLIAVLSQFGVQTTSLIAVLGAAGLAVGLALQGTLSNVAAGVMLLIFRPFRVGDSVEVQGASGTIKEMSLFITEITTSDNLRISVPNGLIWANPVKNLSINGTRRVEISIGVGYSENLERVCTITKEVMAAHPLVLKIPAPEVHLSSFGASSLDLLIRCWSKTSDYSQVLFDLNRAIKERYEAENIEIPYPHQVTINLPPDPHKEA